MAVCEGQTGTLTFASIYGIIGVILSITTMFTIGKLCKDQRERRYVPFVYYMTMIFCFDTFILMLILSFAFPIVLCKVNASTSKFLLSAEYTFLITYFIHSYLLWLLLLNKLYYLFKGTTYNLKYKTIILWIIIFTLSVLLIFATWLTSFIIIDVDSMNIKQRRIIMIIFTLIWSLIVIVPIALSVSFVAKLIQVYKSINKSSSNHTGNISSIGSTHNDLSVLSEVDPILSIITKHTILTLFCIPISTGLMLLSWFSVFIDVGTRSSIHFLGVCYSLYLFNVYINFVCIILSYEVFDGCYRRCCGRIDKQCREYCMERVKDTRSIQMDQYHQFIEI